LPSQIRVIKESQVVTLDGRIVLSDRDNIPLLPDTSSKHWERFEKNLDSALSGRHPAPKSAKRPKRRRRKAAKSAPKTTPGGAKRLPKRTAKRRLG